MKKAILTLGLIFQFVCVIAQTKDNRLWVDKSENGKYGLIDMNKSVIVAHQYDEIKKLVSENISGNEFFRTKLNGKYGIIDKYGKEIIAPKYDGITLYSQAADWIVTELNGKYGFADFCWSEERKKADQILEIFTPKYDSLFYPAGESFPTGFVQVKLNGKWGMANDKTGKEITGMKYDEVEDFYFYQGYDLGIPKLNNKYGLIDANGKEILACKYTEKPDISGDIDNPKITIKVNGKEVFFDKNGKEIK